MLVIEQDVRVGGACVHYGTIPSKTLRESAQSIVSFKQRCAAFFDLQMRKDLEVAHLMSRLQRLSKSTSAIWANNCNVMV